MGLSSSTVAAAAPESTADELSVYDPAAEGPFWNSSASGEAVIRYAKSGIASKEQVRQQCRQPAHSLAVNKCV